MTRYMPILPIGMGELFETVKDCFILPQFWWNEKYKNMYLSRKWDTVIIDNAMYENPSGRYGVDKLIEIAEELDTQRTFIVGNEDMGNGLGTIPLVESELDIFGPSGSKWTYMAVLHGTPGEIVQQFSALRGHPRIAFSIAVSTFRRGWNRAAIHELANMRGRYVHALGLDSLLEARILSDVFDSCDSSMCASAMVNGVDLKLFPEIRRDLDCCKGMTRVDLTKEHFFPYQTERTWQNIILIQNALNGEV